MSDGTDPTLISVDDERDVEEMVELAQALIWTLAEAEMADHITDQEQEAVAELEAAGFDVREA